MLQIKLKAQVRRKGVWVCSDFNAWLKTGIIDFITKSRQGVHSSIPNQ